ncbi:MAG TPA: phosphoribosylglycinamide formyltransferase [Mogibacterium sp.]|nr:phosphoribosylglycinamide formyltransferase [Mogibacterium sp.]
MAKKAKIAVMVSGGGTNLQALIDAQKSGIIKSGEIVLVISNREDAYALERAKNAGIEAYVVSKKSCGGQSAFEEKMIEIIDGRDIDLIVLAGFLTILSEEFVNRYDRKIINVHPALIPSFCGEGFYGIRPHEAALERGVKITGATVHYVNEIADGGEIIAQKAIEVREGDTPEILQRRVMEEAEWKILPEAVEKICSKNIGGSDIDVYKVRKFEEIVASNSYPGRGIVVGESEDGTKAVTAYFIMGRSANSRNRIFRKKEDAVFTEAFDVTKLEDPSLIIYAAVREYKNRLIVTNGNQTDTIYEGIQNDIEFSKALESRTFEPDAPNLTPRISSELIFDETANFTYKMSILKSADAEGSACNRFTYDYVALPGIGHFIHTYECDGNPLPTFQGEPRRISVPDDIDAFTDEIWNSLNEENKISLYVRYTDLIEGKVEERIVNKNQ